MTKTRIVTLTGRAPVEIVEADWPIVARACSDTGNDYLSQSDHSQADRASLLTRYYLMARRHADGRALVYAVVEGPGGTLRHGDLLAAIHSPGAPALAIALRVVGERARVPESTIQTAIASLPPEPL